MAEILSKPPGTLEQASAVAFRDGDKGHEFCLITSISSGRWGFPKGLIDPGATPITTALGEAREEAGIEGRILDDPLGFYRYRKWNRNLNVVVLLMEVTQVESDWLEADVRDRRWALPDEAFDLLEREHLQTMLRLAVERLEGGV